MKFMMKVKKILVKELLLDENETVDSLENRIKELEKDAIVKWHLKNYYKIL